LNDGEHERTTRQSGAAPDSEREPRRALDELVIAIVFGLLAALLVLALSSP
jgi:hypothetical protein